MGTELSFYNYTHLGGIYRIRNMVDGKYYIGSTVALGHRRQQHLSYLRKKLHPNKHLQAAFNKYGEQAFAFEVLEAYSDPTKEELEMWEQWYLDNTTCCDRRYGYNKAVKANSMLGYKHSEESKRRMAEAYHSKTEEEKLLIRRKMSEAGLRRPPMSEETKRKVAEAGRGRRCSEHSKQRTSEVNQGNTHGLGHRHSPEIRKRISEANTGKKRSEEAKKRMSEAAIRRYARERS